MASPADAESKQPPAIVQRVQQLVAWAMATKPARVFLYYGGRRGPILAGGLAFQGLFAAFAAIWAGFSIAGLVVAGNVALQQSLIDTLAGAVPGLIKTPGGSGAIDPTVLLSASVLGWSGAVALVGLLVTALGWLASVRDAMRAILDLPAPTMNPVLLKLRDLGLGLLFAVALIVSTALSVLGSSATSALLSLVGVESQSPLAYIVGRVVTLVVMFALDAVVLFGLFRLIAMVPAAWSELRMAVLLGAVGLGALKVLGGALLGGATSNPLIASFAVIAGLLIFFNFACQVILLAASCLAVTASDHGVVLDPTLAARRLEEARELVAANAPEEPVRHGLAKLLHRGRSGQGDVAGGS